MKVAVVGSGIAGVASAYLLDEAHDVTLYERRDRLGGHAHTVEVTVEGETRPIDTGFIVYNEENYPLFCRFLEELDVPTKPSLMSFSFRSEKSGLEYGGHGLGALFSQRRNLLNPSQWRMLLEIVRFYYSAPRHRSGESLDLTLGAYLDREGYGKSFVRDHILPMVAAIWSVSKRRARRFPFVYVVDFFENHGLLNLVDRPEWRTIEGGSRIYLDRFRDQFGGTIRTGDSVRSLRSSGDTFEVASELENRSYDAVVLACHSDQSAQLLESTDRPEVDLLESIEYQPNDVVLHTDESLLPKDPSIWSSWNYHRFDDKGSAATITFDLSILQDLGLDREVCVSLNAAGRIDENRVLDRFEYAHPVYTEETLRARRGLKDLRGHDDLYLAGAYLGNGFHEDGFRSAVRMASHLGVKW